MLTLLADQPECLWDDALPIEVKELPEDLAALDALLCDPELLWPIVERWRQEFEQTGRLVLTEGRPTIAMETYIRLMVLKARYRWGYRTLVAEVSDSIHLRRFCRISLTERVPDESTPRRLTRRIGSETVAEMTRALLEAAVRQKRFRPRAVRIDSTVIEADVKYPTDAGLASSGVRVLAGEGRKLARRKARGRGARAKLKAAASLEESADRCEKVARQIRQRVAGEPIKDRLVSLFDPDARPIRKGKLGKPNEFGFVSQVAEVTENTKPGARGLILPASTELGNPAEDTLLPGTVAELQRLGISVQEVAVDGGFNTGPTNSALEDIQPKNVFIAGRQEPGSKRTQRRLRRYRTGAEGRISHLKRRYGLDRSRLKGDEGRQIWTEWSILAYNADTLGVRER